MDKKQKINCTVESCKYNNKDESCLLNQITVTSVDNCDVKDPDESMCSNYKNR